jgi:hypothetical protein
MIKSFQEFTLNESLDGGFDDFVPSIFSRTIYRLPNKEEIEEFADADLTAEKVVKGLTYTIVGRGIKTADTKAQIIQAAKMIADAHPDNEEYRAAVKILTESCLIENERWDPFTATTFTFRINAILTGFEPTVLEGHIILQNKNASDDELTEAIKVRMSQLKDVVRYDILDVREADVQIKPMY